MRLSTRHWAVVAASVVSWLGLALMRVMLTPDPSGAGTHEQLGLPPCRSLDWFGIPCPGCGVTTAVTWFAHGEPWKSFVTQPFGFLLAMGAVLAVPSALVATALRVDLGYWLGPGRARRAWALVLVVMGLAWAYKIIWVLLA